jgi:hypothetical protein
LEAKLDGEQLCSCSPIPDFEENDVKMASKVRVVFSRYFQPVQCETTLTLKAILTSLPSKSGVKPHLQSFSPFNFASRGISKVLLILQHGGNFYSISVYPAPGYTAKTSDEARLARPISLILLLAAEHVRQVVFTHRLGQRQASVLAARVVEVKYRAAASNTIYS